MELFIRGGPVYQQLYNCSFYDVSSLPSAQRQHIALGIGFVLVGVVEELLYLPALVVLWEMREKSSCYKMMFLMGVLDVLCLPIAAIATGVFGIMGTVFCSAPNLIYVLGTLAFGLWTSESTLELILALNRCFEVFRSDWAELLFEGHNVWLWMAAPVLYGLYGTFFQQPPVFTAIHMSWFLNPHIGYWNNPPEHMYENVEEIVHNWAIVGALAGTYAVFAAALCYKLNKNAVTPENNTGSSSAHLFATRLMVFLQVALIAAANAINAIIFVYMQYNPVSDAVIVLAQFLWTQSHGLPPVIYLALNQTMRERIRERFFRRQANGPTTVAPVTNLRNVSTVSKSPLFSKRQQ